ncbi:MAG: NADH-ubiquinone oxidoreductase-F iron-sulfur binding region domain-containing protein [Nocardioides sp.]
MSQASGATSGRAVRQPPSPIPIPEQLLVQPGPGLLSDHRSGPSLAAHRRQYGPLARMSLRQLLELSEQARLRGRGGAAFPFATKLRTAASGRGKPVVVVNLSESEPASSKDTALAIARPHLILDGAALAAHALGTRSVHLALPGKRPQVVEQMRAAIRERDDWVRWHTYVGEQHFVAGQSRAVVELLAGRANTPVTAREPEAVSGHKGLPTVLSNAETWAQLGRLALIGGESYRALGTLDEPGTTLLTYTESGYPTEVIEVAYGTPWREVLPRRAHRRHYLVGGFHGSWTTWDTLSAARVSLRDMRVVGVSLGAGVVIVPDAHECPVVFTSKIVDYLADQSAGQCGPCFNGLPALATALHAVRDGQGRPAEVERLAAMVSGRGACTHPDGTVRLVATLLSTFPTEVSMHVRGQCRALTRELA